MHAAADGADALGLAIAVLRGLAQAGALAAGALVLNIRLPPLALCAGAGGAAVAVVPAAMVRNPPVIGDLVMQQWWKPLSSMGSMYMQQRLQVP